MKPKTTVVPEIITEAKAAGCENADQITGYLAGEVSRLRDHAAKLQDAVNEAARCFYGPEEQKPGTWGWDVAAKLHALSSPNNKT